MRGSAEREEKVGGEAADRKQLDFGVACRAGNANRSCESREKERKSERKREGERERGSLFSRRLRRRLADNRRRRGRIEWHGEERERGKERDRETGRTLRGLLLPGGRPDTCSGYIVVKRLPTGPLMARDDILQVGRRRVVGVHRRARRMRAGCVRANTVRVASTKHRVHRDSR